MIQPHAFTPNPKRPRLVVCYLCGRPEWDEVHIQTLPGMADVAELRAAAMAESTGAMLTAKMREPPESINKRTGEIEMYSPLFQGSEANPNRPLF